MYVVRLFSPNYDKGRKKFKVQRLLLFSFFGLPSRLDKPEEVKKKRAWNGMEATPFVLSSSPSLTHNVCMARTRTELSTNGMDERTQRRPSDRGAESGERQ